jgi:hypothetical protein
VTVQSLRTFGAHATDFVDLASDKGEISAVRNSAHRAGLACAAAWSALKTSIIGNNGAPGGPATVQACENRTGAIGVNIANPRGVFAIFSWFSKGKKVVSSSASEAPQNEADRGTLA